ncbi:MAG: heparan-alpha-glucosaminide N-acetyltransferase [Hyphomicrobiales bacterium]
MASQAPLMRLALLDQARGLALVAMIIYHALWDGFQFGLLTWTLERDQTMRLAAQIIAGSFLTISGVSLALSSAASDVQLIQRQSFWKRTAIVAAAAALVSAASFVVLPQAPIYFGILHHIALASVVVALIAPQHAFVAAALAALVVIAKANIALSALNHPATIWLGLGTEVPVTADWVPMFPWLAAGLLGFAIGKQVFLPWLQSRPPSPQKPARDPLTWMGRHSLAIYLVHQPILIALIYLYQWLI